MALQYYVRALEESASGTNALSLEDERKIISNRGYAYLLAGEPYCALRDIDEALSIKYLSTSQPESSRSSLTAKCYYRRAIIHCKLTHYDEALKDYRVFEEIVKGSGGTLKITGAEEATLRLIEDGIAAMKGDDEDHIHRVRLLREVQVSHYT
jgi:tetratricopeptide (TPR) repeat protein